MEGVVSCGKWIKRPENVNLVVLSKTLDSKSVLEIFSYDSNTTSLSSSPMVTHEVDDGIIVTMAVHPNCEEIICSTTSGDCKVFELSFQEKSTKFSVREVPALQDVGLQNCVAFSVDGSKLAIGGDDGHLRIFEWPSMRVIIDEPKAHKSFSFMDFSLDSEFLASTSTSGSARVWNVNEGVPVATLPRKQDEKFELCCFSKDGTRPFLFCTEQKAKSKPVVGVWDMSTWKKIGHKQLLTKPASIISTSSDGKYLALGSRDGDFCVVDVKKMSVGHWSKRLHPGTFIGSLEFCPTERVVLTTTKEWGAKVTKLTVPVEWKDWQIYSILAALFLLSAVAFYIFYVLSDSFWQVPVVDMTTGPDMNTLLDDSHFSEDIFGSTEL
ncbi:SEC12-like protein 1 [Silene latifolia]|uniref:SEC12-like protein 1 n=1 Tax=Silene latifolia TaxID=37657 RepID=UPI003D783672